MCVCVCVQGVPIVVTILMYMYVYMQFPDSSEPSSVPTSVGKSLLTFNIPLNNCGLAGLGVAVHGRCSSGRHGDMGIYIKSIVHGGAAAQVRGEGGKGLRKERKRRREGGREGRGKDGKKRGRNWRGREGRGGNEEHRASTASSIVKAPLHHLFSLL